MLDTWTDEEMQVFISYVKKAIKVLKKKTGEETCKTN